MNIDMALLVLQGTVPHHAIILLKITEVVCSLTRRRGDLQFPGPIQCFISTALGGVPHTVSCPAVFIICLSARAAFSLWVVGV